MRASTSPRRIAIETSLTPPGAVEDAELVERHALRAGRRTRRARPTRSPTVGAATVGGERPSSAASVTAARADRRGRRHRRRSGPLAGFLGLFDHAPNLLHSSPVRAPRLAIASTAKFRPMTISSSTRRRRRPSGGVPRPRASCCRRSSSASARAAQQPRARQGSPGIHAQRGSEEYNDDDGGVAGHATDAQRCAGPACSRLTEGSRTRGRWRSWSRPARRKGLAHVRGHRIPAPWCAAPRPSAARSATSSCRGRVNRAPNTRAWPGGELQDREDALLKEGQAEDGDDDASGRAR